MMLTPENTDGIPRSRLRLEVTPTQTSSGQNLHGTPGNNLHFNSQQYHTPNSRPQHVQLLNLQSPHFAHLSPHGGFGGGLRGTPRVNSKGQHQVTPGSGGSSGGRYEASRTPRGSQFRTPKGDMYYNPFELDPDVMEGCMFSPGVFSANTGTQSSQKASSPFWSIDHIAMMKPADIEEMPAHQGSLSRFKDNEMEERAQRAINDFFSKNLVGKSPWSEDGKPKPIVYLSPSPSTPGYDPVVGGGADGSCSMHATQDGKKDAGCQTTLTLPTNFDLYKLLAQYYTQSAKDEGGTDILSTSSLRRKLFFHGDEESPPSPVSSEAGRRRSSSVGPEVEGTSSHEPTCCVTPEPHHTPGSLFASSPIQSGSSRGFETPGLKRCSTAPDLMASPELSPIITNVRRSSARSKSRETQSSSEGTPLCMPLQATPSSGRPSLPFSSPGVSPIRLDLSPLDHCTSDSYPNRMRRSKPTLFKLPAPPELSACESPKSSYRSSHGDQRSLGHDMEVDRSMSFVLGNQEGNAHEDFGNVPSFTLSDSEVVDELCTQDPVNHPAHSTQVTHSQDTGCTSLQLTNQDTGYNTSLQLTNQDTGYNTTSLQLTNQDTGYITSSLQLTNQDAGFHTNLTNQFGSLLPLSSRDTGLEADFSNYSQNLDPVTTFPTAKNIFNPEDEVSRDTRLRNTKCHQNVPCRTTFSSCCPKDLDESLIVRRARAVLGKLAPEEGVRSNSCGGHQKAALQPTCMSKSEKSPWQPLSSPERQQLHRMGLIGDKSAEEKFLMPSTVAFNALRRAGEDYEKFCQDAGRFPDNGGQSELSGGEQSNYATDYLPPEGVVQAVGGPHQS